MYNELFYNRGDIFYSDLSPTVGSEQGGMRPVVIIQNNTGNKYSPTVIVAAITSQITKAKLPTHVELKAKEYGLIKDSVVLCEQVRTLDKKRLKTKIGHISNEKMNQIDKATEVSVGLKIQQPIIKTIDLTYIRDSIDTINEITEEYEIYHTESAKRIMDSCIVRLFKYCKKNNIDAKSIELQLRNGHHSEFKKVSC